MQRPRPSTQEVVGRLKDDGDFDSLRRKIIRSLKDNEELRKSIIEEVKQSVVLNEDGSEKMRIRELSDAIYNELGSKLLARISDATWDVIKSTEDEIRGTVESVYHRIVNPENQEEQSSPRKKSRISGEHLSPSKSLSPGTKDDEGPPGFALPDRGVNSSGEVQQQISTHEEQERSSSDEDEAPPGFGSGDDGVFTAAVDEEDPDLPPGFG